MESGPGEAAGVVVESVTLEGRHHFIRLRGSWDLLNRERLAHVFADVPDDFDVVVDIQEVSYCDSTILTEFIRLYKRLGASGRRIDVVLGDSAVRRLFRTMHLDKLLAARADRERERGG
ncbi:MAG TPA: STAS domain-containing protein [Candidatus Acidoferrales bacterium]|nr:STAS domain-containing protein [Candidatus Acidoferrales bacterium]